MLRKNMKKTKNCKYHIFCDRSLDGTYFFARTGRFSDWVTRQEALTFARLKDAKRFMTFAKLFDCTYD